MNFTPCSGSNFRAAVTGSRHQTDVPFLNEVGQRHAAVLVFLRDADDEAQVGAGQLLDRLFVALLGEGAQLLLTVRCDQLVPTDVAQILVQRALLFDAGVESGEEVLALALPALGGRLLVGGGSSHLDLLLL